MHCLVTLRFKAPQYPNFQDEKYLKLSTFTFLIFSYHMRYPQDSRIQFTLAIPPVCVPWSQNNEKNNQTILRKRQ